MACVNVLWGGGKMRTFYGGWILLDSGALSPKSMKNSLIGFPPSSHFPHHDNCAIEQILVSLPCVRPHPCQVFKRVVNDMLVVYAKNQQLPDLTRSIGTGNALLRRM